MAAASTPVRKRKPRAKPSHSRASASNAQGPNKDDLFWKILDTVIRLECTRGHMRWRMTDLSRASGVTRSLIYYYFGQSKIKLVHSAIEIIGEEFFGLNASRHQLWENGQVPESIRATRELFKKAPYVGIFYLSQRQPGAVFHKEILNLEKRYLDRLARSQPGSSREKLQLTFATVFGICMLYDLSDSILSEIEI